MKAEQDSIGKKKTVSDTRKKKKERKGADNGFRQERDPGKRGGKVRLGRKRRGEFKGCTLGGGSRHQFKGRKEARNHQSQSKQPGHVVRKRKRR